MSFSTPTSPVTVIALADSDSYLKWAAATLDTLNADFRCHLVLVRSPIMPSPQQIEAALAGTRFSGQDIRALRLSEVKKYVERCEPDVLLLAATGPVVELVAELSVRMKRRPALISGIPGMALPARIKGMRYRARCHSLIVHSRIEATEYGAVADLAAMEKTLVLSHLPFLPALQQPRTRKVSTVLFTPQALVPSTRTARVRILQTLHDTALAHPNVRIVIKVRALKGEQQTHRERFAYDDLWADMCRNNTSLSAQALSFATGPLTDFFDDGVAHVTVSSTAALESLAYGLPTLILRDFGLNERMLNSVFATSGLVGTLNDVAHIRFNHVNDGWLEDNYFHEQPSQLPQHVKELAAASRARTLPLHSRAVGRKRLYSIARNAVRTMAPAHVTRLLKRLHIL
ncbi:DUF6716 putative glycosyltransferase [Timonella sp. A28]|uniref:DUF6716 putative glycosyltransferase n=1 Tax=Timonella sp. A28 TaxID=3442640 RepID=UPI003EB80AE5